MAKRASGGAGIDLPTLRKAVAEGSVEPAYLLLGDEAALRRRAIDCLRSAFNEEQGMPGAVTQLDGHEISLAELIDEAKSIPLFGMMADGPGRLVWVTGFEQLVARTDDTAPLAELLDSPVAGTCLVFEAAKLDKRKAAYKALTKSAVVVDCETPKSERDVSIWIEATLRNRGYAVERDAIAYLLQMAGTRITVLEQELDKAMLYVGEGGTVRAVDLQRIMGRTREHSVFELTDALVRADTVGAVRLLNMLLDDGESPVGVLAMIGWICRQLVLGADLAASGCSRKEAMEGLGGRWQQRGAILDRAQRADRAELLDMLVGCAETDLFVKRMRDARKGADALRPARGRLEALCRQICAA